VGFLDRHKDSTTLTVAAPTTPVAPGEAVELRFELGGAVDPKVHALRVALSGVGTFITQERGYDGEGHAHNTDVLHQVSIHDEERDFPATPGPGQTTFTVPAGSPPSSADAVAWVAWVGLVAEGDPDHVQRTDVVVRVPTPAATVQADASSDGLTFSGLPDYVRAGEPISATVTVNVADDVKAAVSVRLNRRRTYVAQPIAGRDAGVLLADAASAAGTPVFTNDELGVVQVVAAERRDFAAGTPVALAFTIAVPADAGPSTTYANGEVDWRIEATLDRRLHADVSVLAPIVVT
jgi:hypothetical protein